jgi:catalase
MSRTPNVTQRFIDTILNPIDNCLARRVAYGIGAAMSLLGSGPMTNMTNSTARFPSLYPLAPGQEPRKSNAGLVVGIVAADDAFTQADLAAMSPLLAEQQVSYGVVSLHQGMRATGISANKSYITSSDIHLV